MKWLRAELLYARAWAWIVCGIALKHLGFDLAAITCFDKGVHCATRSANLYGTRP